MDLFLTYESEYIKYKDKFKLAMESERDKYCLFCDNKLKPE